MYSKEEMTPFCLDLFADISSLLPEELASRLTCNRRVINHGSYRTFFMFSFWDKHQVGVLDRSHFCYGLRYDPMMIHNSATPWHFHLWINTIRIYQSQEEIRQILEKDVRRGCPRPFKFFSDQRSVCLRWDFTLDDGLRSLSDTVAKPSAKLVRAVHPILVPIIDSFTQPLSKAERRKVILSREKIYIPHERRDPDVVREYTRSIPGSYRRKLLEKHKSKCAHCGVNLQSVEVHIDHILPFSKGGKTVIENLQPLCGPCNLKKGNRLTN